VPSEQFSQAVRGSNATPVSVSQRGSIDTNDYPEGDGSDEDGSAYPYTINPAEVIKEVGFPIVESEIVATITTTSGTSFDVVVASPTTWDRWDIDQIELTDPNGSGGRIAYWWAGE
jgi:hypothetical protein